MEELAGSVALTAMSASPPPGATPRFSGVPTLLAHPPFVKLKMPQLSGWPSYLNGSVRLLLGGPSSSNRTDRKSTRLNSSHGYISYAVFCLKKKKKKISKSTYYKITE